MKKLSVLLALFALTFAELCFASAVVTSATGVTQVQTGAAPARPLRTGDRVNQGDTVTTGGASSLVMKFDDGQVAALTANSRLTVTAYSYRPAEQKGNSLLSLVSGGMRMITGLIGKNSPQNVSVRAATATIGIRGTDFDVIARNGKVYAHVNGGSIEFTYGDQKVTVETGRAVITEADGKVTQGTINQILSQLQLSDIGKQIAEDIGGITALTNAINNAFPGTPTQGQQGGQGQPDSDIGTGTSTGGGGGAGVNPTGGGGGTTASPS